VEYLSTQNIRSLHGRTFVLNSTIGSRISAFVDRRFHVLVLLGSLFSFGFRGAQYNPQVFGDDATLVSHALDRQPPWGIFGHFDKLGLFDPFNDYLAVLLRIVTRVALIGPDSGFTFRLFVIMTIFWAIVTWAVALVIKKRISANAGLIGALMLCWLPFSNQVFLAQANTVAWPLTLLCIVIVALKNYPTTFLRRLALIALYSLTALSTGTMIVVIGWLVFDAAISIRKFSDFRFVLLIFTCISFCFQWYTYKPRSNEKLSLGHEMYRTLYSWSPQFIRNKIGEDLSMSSTLILWLIPLLLIISWTYLFVDVYRHNRSNALASLQLFITSLLLPILLIVGNGWLNTHYMFIPAALFWISTLILGASLQDRWPIPTRIAIATLSILYCAAISGAYYVL